MFSVEFVNQPVSAQKQHSGCNDAKGQGQQGGGQGRNRNAPGLEQPCDQNDNHRAKGHAVAVGEIGKAQDAVDQSDTQGAKGQLAAIGNRGHEHEIGDDDNGVQKVNHPLNSLHFPRRAWDLNLPMAESVVHVNSASPFSAGALSVMSLVNTVNDGLLMDRASA